VKSTLQFIWTSVLSLDLVVECSNVGRNLSSYDSSRGSEEYTEGSGRKIHDSVPKRDEYVGLKKGETRSSREEFVSCREKCELSPWGSMINDMLA
jgi:hypothetical protein